MWISCLREAALREGNVVSSRLFSPKRLLIVVGIGLSGIQVPASANPALIAGPLATSHMAIWVGANGTCYSITYDKNGNRISQTSAGIASSQLTWGSSAYGCSLWQSV